MSDYTPAPWRIKEGRRHSPEECDLTIAGDIFLLAHITGPNYAHCYANARMMSAAPTMHETLKWLRVNYADGSTKEINARIDAAIAKAEGK